MDQPANNSWLPSLQNIVYTAVLTLLAVYGLVSKWRKDRTDAEAGRALQLRGTIDQETETTERAASAWESQWRACNAEVDRLGRVITAVRAERDTEVRKRELAELEVSRLERKCEHVVEQQQTIVAKVDGISRQLERMMDQS